MAGGSGKRAKDRSRSRDSARAGSTNRNDTVLRGIWADPEKIWAPTYDQFSRRQLATSKAHQKGALRANMASRRQPPPWSRERPALAHTTASAARMKPAQTRSNQ
jgi:hypothetical protein